MLPNMGTRFFVILIVLAIPTLILLVGGDFQKGLDIEGGTSLIYNVPGDPSDEALAEVKEVMSQRVDRLGLKEITITTDPARDDIIIELPGMAAEDAKNVKNTLLELGKLLWAIEVDEQELATELGPRFEIQKFIQQQVERTANARKENPDQFDDIYTGEPVPLFRNPDNPLVARTPGEKPVFMYFPPYKWKTKKLGITDDKRIRGPKVGAIVWVDEDREDKRTFSGEEIENVYPSQSRFEPVVAFELKAESKEPFRELTDKNKKRNLCIIFNERLVTRPVIQATLPGSGIIEGIGEREEIRKLIVTIKSGSLKIKPVLFMEQQIGPTLGEDAIQRGMLAIIVGSALVLLFMIWIYRVGGLLANVALLFNLVVLLGIMKMMGATLSLPGIAGIILTIGIAVDANILIFERVKEEREKGKTFIQSLKNGYDRATVTILDANITTLITGLVLYMFGTGAVRGFAFVLIAGLLVNLFTAIYMTKTVMAWLVDHKRISDLKVVRLFKPPDFDFLALGKMAMVISLLLIIGGLYIFFAVQGNKIKGLDFSGGALMRVQLKEPMAIADFRDLIHDAGEADENIDIVTVKGRAARTLKSGDGSNIFEIKKSFAQEEKDSAEIFFQTIRKVLHAKLVDDPVVAYQAPAGHSYQYNGPNGDDPGRIPTLPANHPPRTDEEKLIAQSRQGFRFAINFYKPTGRSMLEQNLNTIQVKPVKITPRGKQDAEGRYRSYEVWCEPGPYTVQTRKNLSALAAGLSSQLKKEVPPVHLSDPVPVQRFIGSRVATDFLKKALLAIIVSIVALIIYIRVRFHDIIYGLGASAALVHDVLITMGAIALFDELGLVNVKITLPIIAAFLTIIGYSLNDTIVIFDRLRENLGRVNLPLKDAMNQSITQSLTRTFFTSLTTFFVVACLFIFNYGERGVLEGLGFALMVGVVTGTYSTIFIACPTVLLLNRARKSEAQVGGKARTKPA